MGKQQPKQVKSLQDRLLSRKWILAVGAVIYFALYKQFDSIAQVVIAYLAIQAGVDAFTTYQEAKQPEETE